MAEIDAVARLRIVSELRGVAEDLQDLADGNLTVEKAVDRLQKTVAGAADKLEKFSGSAGGAGKGARKSGDDAGKGAKGFEAYAEALDKAQAAQRKFSQDAVRAKFPASAVPTKPVSEMSGTELDRLLETAAARDASSLAEARKLKAAKVAAEKEAADQIKRINDVAAAQWIANEERKATEAKRAADVVARQWIEAEERRLKASDDVAKRIASAPNKQTASYIAANTGGFNLGSEGGDGAGAAKWVADYDAQVQRLAEQSSPRLRYALYDVARTATVLSAAITGAGAAVGVMAAQQESAFTNVERTLDNVGVGQVAALREELVGLTRDIPLAFSDVASIATLGNQLGIAAGDVASFTQTVAKFSAVTGMTAEASATAFGGIGELLNVTASQYEQLGSSIALVGRRSVATEAEIVAMTTRLAASASNAGFTAQQVVALSGAFASLRIAPERAQGVMEIYFKRLNTAIADGGGALDAFARVARVASGDVEELVRTDPVGFFERLATGLGQLDSISQTRALEDLGLQGIRAGEVFGRVSANVEVFNKALGDAHQGWSEGTELGDQYAKVVDDMAARWQIFLNAVQEAGAAVGTALAPAIIWAIDLISGLVQNFAAFAQSDVGGVIVRIAGALGVLVAGLSGLAAVLAVAGGSLFAMRLALVELGFVSVGASAGMRGATAAALGLGSAVGVSTKAIHGFRIALATTGIGLAVVALGAIAGAFMSAGDAADQFSVEAQRVGEALNSAIATDTATYQETGEAFATYSRELSNTATAADTAAAAARKYAGAQGGVDTSVDEATQKIKDQTVALGANTEAYFRNELAKDENFKNLANDPALRSAAEQVGFSVDQLIASGMRKSGGFSAYVEEMRQKSIELTDKAGSVDQGSSRAKALYDEAAAYWDIADAIAGYAGKMDEGRAAADAAATAIEYAGSAATGAADGLGDVGNEALNFAENMFEAERATLGIEGRLYDLGASLGENVGMWDIYSEGGRQNLGALMAVMDAIAAETPGNARAIASNFIALYNTLIQGGAATADQLAIIRAQVKSLAGEAGMSIAPAARDFSSLFNGITVGAGRAARAIGGGGRGGGGGGGQKSLKEEIRTLLDYAKDLGGVMSRAFDLRFGNQQALDKVASQWIAIAEANEKAAEAVDEFKRKLRDLQADKDIKEYQLKVAVEYGDDERAAKLRAEIAEVNADQTATTKDLSKAQKENSKTLSGNSKEAIDNRNNILGLVGGYRELLEEYAANGMSQAQLKVKAAQLKNEFIAQATQAGYSRTEVLRYAKSFDDMKIAIDRVPRNITVKANTNPALQALNEFLDKAKKASATVKIGGSGDGYGAGAAAGNAYGKGWAEAVAKQRRLVTVKDSTVPGGLKFRFVNQPGSPYFFRKGGYTGNVGVNQPAGIVHGQEYVFSAPAVRNAGGPNAMNYVHDMLKRGKGGFASAGVAGGGGMDAAAMDYLARRIAYHSKSLTINSESIRGAYAAATAASYRQGRG